MVTAAIVINQAGKPPGLPSTSRDDLALGVSVTLTNNDNTGVVSWFWEFISIPVGSSAVISGAALPTASFTPDVRGSYLIKLTVDESPTNPDTDTRIAAVKTSFLGIRKPATSERKEFDSTDGWSAAQQSMIDAIDTDASLSLKRNGSNQPTADINWGANKITNLGGLENEGTTRLGETSDPAFASNKGFLYAKDDSGDTELFYMDDSGAAVQITKDGQLDVVSLQGDALPAKAANSFLKRNLGNTGWEEVPYGTGANTVCQGNDSRLSDSRAPTGPASGQLGGTYPGPDVRGMRESGGPTLLTIGTILDGQILVRYGSAVVGSSVTGAGGGLVKVRVDDTADGYLHSKLLTGPGLSFAIGNPGGNETLTIDAYGVLKVSSNDTTFGYLEDKLVIGAGVSLTTLNEGGNETRQIDAYGTKVSVTDTHIGFLQGKLVAGDHVTLTRLNPGGNEIIQITAGVTLDQAYDQGGPGAGRTITVDSGPVRMDAGGGDALELDGYLTLAEVSTPPSLANKGLVFARDDGGDTELYYKDDKNRTVQITKDGLLDFNYQLKVSATDTTPNYLLQKLVAGLNIVLAQGSPGGNETLSVALPQVLRLVKQVADPSPFVDGYLYSRQSAGLVELFYMDNAGQVSKLTRDGYLADGYARDDSLDAVGGETSLTLTAPPRFAFFKASGRELDVYRNGVLLKWASAPADNNQWMYNAGAQRIEFGAPLVASDWVRAAYRSYS